MTKTLDEQIKWVNDCLEINRKFNLIVDNDAVKQVNNETGEYFQSILDSLKTIKERQETTEQLTMFPKETKSRAYEE